MEVKIVGVETLGSYQVYVIEFVQGKKRWTVKQRYSAFDEVRKVVMRENMSIDTAFPAKSMFGAKLTEAQLAKRREQLEAWLKDLSSSSSALQSQAVRRSLADFVQEPPSSAHCNEDDDQTTAPSPPSNPAPAAQWDESFMSSDPLAAFETASSPVEVEEKKTKDPPHRQKEVVKRENNETTIEKNASPVIGDAPSFFLSSTSLQTTAKSYEASGEGLRDAVKDGNVEGVTELLTTNPKLANYQDRQMESMLHLACIFNHSEIALALVRAGASTTVKNHNGETPLDLALPSLATSIRNAVKQT